MENTHHGGTEQRHFGKRLSSRCKASSTCNRRLRKSSVEAGSAATWRRYGSANNGNVINIQNCRDGNRTQNFTYDALNRITQAYTNGPNWGEVFTVDAWGNLTNRTQSAGKVAYEPWNAPANAPPNAPPVTPSNQLTGYAYDAAGNMLTGPSGASTIAYDAESRISTAGVWSYVYDGDGTRMAKASSGVVNKIYWRGGGSDVLGESDGTGSFTEEYVFFNGRRIGRRDVAAGGVDYYLSDHLSTASVIATSLGGNKEESDYYPYGGELPISGADSNNYKFTGKERDSESGLDMFGARYYGSSLGRFMTPDWAAKPTNVPYASFGNPQSLNLYSYVNNNPTTTRDPDGHVAGVDDAAEALVFTAAVFTTAVVIYESQPQNQRNFAEATSQAFTNTVDTVKSWFQSSPKQSQSNPWQGKPGETVQTTRPDGTPQQTRRYGPDGYPETDVDHSPHHGQPDPTPTILGVLRMVPLRPLPTVAPEEMYSQAIHSHSNNSNHRRNHSNRCSHSRRHLHHRNKRSLSRKE